MVIPANNNNILSHIGNTPLVQITNLGQNPETRVLAKVESFNPGGSVKDRIACRVIEQAEKKGELTKKKTIIEATSGNTGIGLALVGKVKGYKTILVMPGSVSTERISILKAYGTELVLTPSEKGVDGAIEYVEKKVKEEPDKYYHPDQFGNPENVLAHYHGTGKEILEQTGGVIDYFIAGMGTGGTLMGVGRRIRERVPGARIVGVEPMLNHKVQGLKNMTESRVPPIFKKESLDEVVNVSDDDAFSMTKKMLVDEGLFVGLSSGAAMSAAIKKSWEIKGGTIVVLLPDGGAKYLSTGVFSKGEGL